MSVIGVVATIASLTIVGFGLPSQILENYRRKSCDGLAPYLVYSACCTYTLWSLYGWTKPDWFLAVAQTPGCLLAFILLFQLIRYRKKPELKRMEEKMVRIQVKKVEKTKDGGFLAVFQEGDNEHPVLFPNSFLKADGTIDGERFLMWGAMKSPFDFKKLDNPVLAIADLMNQIEPMLAQLANHNFFGNPV